MSRYRLSALPETGIRSTVRVDEGNCQDVAARFGPVIAFRMACRSFDATIDTDAGRQAVWSAIRGPESVVDAAAATGTDATWVQMMLDKRDKYLRAIASRLGLTARTATKAQHDDLEPEPAGTVDPQLREAVRAGVRASFAEAKAGIQASKSLRLNAQPTRRRR
jgi:hypothetical protein